MFERVEIIKVDNFYTLSIYDGESETISTNLTLREALSRLQPPKKARPAAQFESFWEAYPKVGRVAKARCVEIWKRLNLDRELSSILRGIDLLSETDRWKGGFIPNASTFLNQRRWEDAEELGTTKKEKPKSSRIEKFRLAGGGVSIFPVDDDIAIIDFDHWDYGPDCYYGDEGFINKLTGETVPMSQYKPKGT